MCSVLDDDCAKLGASNNGILGVILMHKSGHNLANKINVFIGYFHRGPQQFCM